MNEVSTPKVYESICSVMEDIGHSGISKGRRNQQQGYSFRGIDDVYNELNALLSKHKVIMTPRILAREVAERQTQKGSALFYVTVEAEFDFISAEDGSKHTVRTFGEAMDSADKATNKAMSAAYKYAAMMVFCIPTEGDNDADAVTHEVAARFTSTPNTVTGPAIKPASSASLKRDGAWERLESELRNDFADCHSIVALAKLRADYRVKAKDNGWPAAWLGALKNEFDLQEDALLKAETLQAGE